MHPWFKSPFEKSPEDYGINDRPVLIEESPAKDAGLSDIPITLVQAYESALAKGYQGNLPWTSNGVDANGSISTIGPATLSFKNNHSGLVYPLQSVAEVKTIPEDQILIYPNPSNGKFTVDGTINMGQTINLEIYNMLGEKAYLALNFRSQSSNEIDLSNFPNGVYILKLYEGTATYTQKIIVQKP